MSEDLNRYERLQEAAEKQINRAWKAYAILGSLVTIIFIAGMFFTYHSIRDFKNEIRNDITTEKDIVEKRVNARIDGILTERNIRQIVAERVALVTDTIISNKIHAEFDPKLRKIAQDLESYESTNKLYAAKSLFSNTVFENYSASSTNVISGKLTNNVSFVVIKLQAVPISGSIEASAWPGTPLNIPVTFQQPIKCYRNILFQVLYGFDLSKTSFTIRYVKDSSKTNLIQNIKLRGNEILADGVPINLDNFH